MHDNKDFDYITDLSLSIKFMKLNVRYFLEIRWLIHKPDVPTNTRQHTGGSMFTSHFQYTGINDKTIILYNN